MRISIDTKMAKGRPHDDTILGSGQSFTSGSEGSKSSRAAALGRIWPLYHRAEFYTTGNTSYEPVFKKRH